MSALGLTYQKAFARVKAARNVVSLNKGFEMQLRAYEKVSVRTDEEEKGARDVHVAVARRAVMSLKLIS